MQIYRRGITELNLLPVLALDSPPEVWLAAFYPVVRSTIDQRKFVLDRSYRRRDDIPPRVLESLELLEQALQRDFRVTELTHAFWPLWLVEPR
jgi:hypothetical protein